MKVSICKGEFLTGSVLKVDDEGFVSELKIDRTYLE